MTLLTDSRMTEKPYSRASIPLSLGLRPPAHVQTLFCTQQNHWLLSTMDKIGR